jgi:hypothetical protein
MKKRNGLKNICGILKNLVNKKEKVKNEKM